jgi:hypothetical protein
MTSHSCHQLTAFTVIILEQKKSQDVRLNLSSSVGGMQTFSTSVRFSKYQ